MCVTVHEAIKKGGDTMAKRYCECKKRLGSFRRQKKSKKNRWMQENNDGHHLCTRCWKPYSPLRTHWRLAFI